MVRRFVFAIGILSAAAVVRADTLSINFDTLPALTTGPNLYQDAGPAETIILPGAGTISGGVVLGVGSSLAGVPGVTAPNIYATASDNVIGAGGFGLGNTISIDLPAGLVANEATIPVINGLLVPVSYTVTAFAGWAQISQQLLSEVPAFESATATFTVPGITSITIMPVEATQWDFAIDTITLAESPDPNKKEIISLAPEPGSWALALAGVLVIGLFSPLRRLARKCG